VHKVHNFKAGCCTVLARGVGAGLPVAVRPFVCCLLALRLQGVFWLQCVPGMSLCEQDACVCIFLAAAAVGIDPAYMRTQLASVIMAGISANLQEPLLGLFPLKLHTGCVTCLQQRSSEVCRAGVVLGVLCGGWWSEHHAQACSVCSSTVIAWCEQCMLLVSTLRYYEE